MLDVASLLDRAPRRLRRFAYRIAAGKGILGGLADVMRFRFSEEEVPSLPPEGDREVRVFIGPADSAGQGFQWARAIERYLPATNAVAMVGIGATPSQPRADIQVPVAVYQRSASWHGALEEYLTRRTHVIWESGLPLLGRRFGSDVRKEIEYLRVRGVKGALLFHGSDIRPPSQHAAQSRWSPFRDVSGPIRALEEGALENAALSAESGIPIFVSTPDLIRWLPQSIWCPVVVDTEKWKGGRSGRSSGPLIVVHAPSRPWLKGTHHIEPVLRRLSSEGLIEYRQVVGVPHQSMPAIYADADVVLDQFMLGSYGVAACEAMASGRVVFCHVDDATRALVRKETGLDLPLQEATIESLEAELRRVVAEPEAYEYLRTAGPNFVGAVHSGRRSAEAMRSFLKR